MEAKDFLEKYNISTNEVIYSSDDEAHRLVDLMNGFIKELTELKKLRVADVSICTCGSTKYYSEQYKDVPKYFCSNCHQKLPSKH